MCELLDCQWESEKIKVGFPNQRGGAEAEAGSWQESGHRGSAGSHDLEPEPKTIPGALHMDASEFEDRIDSLSHGKGVIPYAPDKTKLLRARAALLLRKNGIEIVRPLEGGLDAWRERGCPTAPPKTGKDNFISAYPGPTS